ncbi:hypothetical protein ACIPSE_42295 [Streptomyces sp. NPDC090106]|uniref:hypothetical protein n=1 Tax=Streptomyces sp. NPDC090106 TaxID=3365946 RepID=UPI0038223C40
MAVSLGMRISGLLVVGAVAVAAAAFTGDGSGTADGSRDGRGIVTAGPSGTAPLWPTGVPLPSSAPVLPTPDLKALGPAVSRTPGAAPAPAAPSPTPTPTPSAEEPAPRSPAWLPPGPDSPDSDGASDPSSVYDRLRAPGRCRTVLAGLPAQPADGDWRLLRGLATACLAVQGQGGSWDTAAKDYAALSGRADTCKGRAAYSVLGGLLDFHRRHPAATVRLTAPSGTEAACAYRISGVDSGGDGRARPGDVVGVELTGLYFDRAELLRDGRVSLDGQGSAGPPAFGSASGDDVVLNAVVPELEPGEQVDVTVTLGDVEVTARDAFVVDAPEPVSSPSPSPVESQAVTPQGDFPGRPGDVFSGAPEGVFPFGPLPAHRPGAQSAAGLRIP